MGTVARRAMVAATAALALAGCATGPATTTDPGAGPDPVAVDELPPVPHPDDVDPARLAPLEGLPDCPAPPPAAPDVDTGDLPLPVGAVVTGGSVQGALQSGQGYTPRTPVEVLVDYLRLGDWTVLTAEDEVFEAEILLERDGLRVFAKAQATCERGAAFVLFGSTDEALVPAPAGAGG